jgi:membrane protein
VYYSAQIFLLGAEFTWAYAHHSGSRQAIPDAKEAVSSIEPPATSPAAARRRPVRPVAVIAAFLGGAALRIVLR